MTKRKEAQNLELARQAAGTVPAAGLARRPGVSVDDAVTGVVPEPKQFTMRSLDDMAETVESTIQPLVMALSTGRSDLLKLFKPTGPLPEDEQVRLMNLIRVLMDTNWQLKQYAKQLQTQLATMVELFADNRSHQLASLEKIRKAVAEYKPLIGPHNDQ